MFGSVSQQLMPWDPEIALVRMSKNPDAHPFLAAYLSLRFSIQSVLLASITISWSEVMGNLQNPLAAVSAEGLHPS
jgi:hypothetical protein